MCIGTDQIMAAVKAYDARMLEAAVRFSEHADGARMIGEWTKALEEESSAAGMSTQLLGLAHKAYSALH
jgi:hypothetical protein